MGSPSEFETVRRLAGEGLSDRAIARRTGIPRSTVQNWRRREKPPRGEQSRPPMHWRPTDEGAYAYLLGLYLGDGHLVSTSPRSWRLGIYMDESYPGVIAEAVAAVGAQVPGMPVRVNRRTGAKVVLASSAIWPLAFPQHGPGRKHEREIRLEPWQRAITGRLPGRLLRGLIHSDGCRTTNRFQTKLASGRVAEYAYPRYFFTNASSGIRAIFCEHCELLGVRWSRSNARNISVADRGSVAILDRHAGTKS